MSDVRLINANALLNSFDVAWMVEYDETGCGMRKKAIPTKTIEAAPTIDAVPVVHGRWIEIRDKYNYRIGMKCSECKRKVRSVGENYCPNCGAKMDGGA